MLTEFQQEIDRIIEKIDRNMEAYGARFPHLHREGRYAENFAEDGSWTGSFWTGMVGLAYRVTGDSRYIDYLQHYFPLYQERLRTGYTDHDLGFLYQLYAVEAYRLTDDEKYRRLAVDAADKLLERYNERGQFIRAWGTLHSDERRGKIIIDCMMNLPLLYEASALTGASKYREAAEGHADSSRKHLLRADASTYHTFDFDPDSGEPLGGRCEDGYADESTWSRGQAWGVYGFQMSYEWTGRQEFRETAERMADYFIRNLPSDQVPLWDFRLPEDAIELKDTSAAAIAISGLFDLADALAADKPERAAELRRRALDMLSALVGYSSAFDPAVSGILSCCYGRTEGRRSHMYTIWGDYYYLEALLKATGRNWHMWSRER
jgi:unsaturated chondroitin disaccharide hydrolase